MSDSMKDFSEDISEQDLDELGEGLTGESGQENTPETSTSNIVDVLKSKSPEEPLENFMDHPLNFDETESTAQGIRGLKGFLGALNYALVDLFLAVMRKMKEKQEDQPGVNGAADTNDTGRKSREEV